MAFNTALPAQNATTASAAATTHRMGSFGGNPGGGTTQDIAALLRAGFKLPAEEAFQNPVSALMNLGAAATYNPAFNAVYPSFP